MTEEELRVSVYLSMSIAVDNGYSFEGWTNDQIAKDLIRFDSEFEGMKPMQLYAPIQSWRNKQYGIPE